MSQFMTQRKRGSRGDGLRVVEKLDDSTTTFTLHIAALYHGGGAITICQQQTERLVEIRLCNANPYRNPHMLYQGFWGYDWCHNSQRRYGYSHPCLDFPPLDWSEFYVIARECYRRRDGFVLFDWLREQGCDSFPFLSQFLYEIPVGDEGWINRMKQAANILHYPIAHDGVG